MAFVLQQNNDTPIDWPVKVNVPRSGGKVERQAFTARFKQLDQEEIDDKAAQGDAEFVREILVGWEGVKDIDGNVIEYSESGRDIMIRTVHVRKAILAAYFECMSGITRKN
ncbi:MAG: hypothetical protein JMN25_15790 [gamma proteobacterium endosymbiont of Lamellibrachia anaximandri]|nr:hypothetical protein [gamma proteobacterium endosymbiont of Lamellibrachia anaximandri]